MGITEGFCADLYCDCDGCQSGKIYPQGQADFIGALVEALEKAQQRIVELESRTVTVKLPEPPGPMSVGARTVYFGIVADVVGAFQDGLNAAGIKVEAE